MTRQSALRTRFLRRWSPGGRAHLDIEVPPFDFRKHRCFNVGEIFTVRHRIPFIVQLLVRHPGRNFFSRYGVNLRMLMRGIFGHIALPASVLHTLALVDER